MGVFVFNANLGSTVIRDWVLIRDITKRRPTYVFFLEGLATCHSIAKIAMKHKNTHISVNTDHIETVLFHKGSKFLSSLKH
jgi:hypothetical protein